MVNLWLYPAKRSNWPLIFSPMLKARHIDHGKANRAAIDQEEEPGKSKLSHPISNPTMQIPVSEILRGLSYKYALRSCAWVC